MHELTTSPAIEAMRTSKTAEGRRVMDDRNVGICLRYMDGHEMTEIAEMVGVGQERIRQILHENKIEMRPALPTKHRYHDYRKIRAYVKTHPGLHTQVYCNALHVSAKTLRAATQRKDIKRRREREKKVLVIATLSPEMITGLQAAGWSDERIRATLD